MVKFYIHLFILNGWFSKTNYKPFSCRVPEIPTLMLLFHISLQSVVCMSHVHCWLLKYSHCYSFYLNLLCLDKSRSCSCDESWVIIIVIVVGGNLIHQILMCTHVCILFIHLISYHSNVSPKLFNSFILVLSSLLVFQSGKSDLIMLRIASACVMMTLFWIVI